MTPGLYREMLQDSALIFAGLVVFCQYLTLRDLRARAAGPEFADRNVRDHLVGALLRVGLRGLLPVVVYSGWWIWTQWDALGARALTAGQLTAGFLFLSLGLAALAVRWSFRAMRAEDDPRTGLLLARLVPLAGGLAYAAALWFRVPATAAETLTAVWLLGFACLVLGINRSDTVPPEVMQRWAQR